MCGSAAKISYDPLLIRRTSHPAVVPVCLDSKNGWSILGEDVGGVHFRGRHLALIDRFIWQLVESLGVDPASHGFDATGS